MNTKGIAVGVGANLAPLRQDFSKALAEADKFRRSIESRLEKLNAGSMKLPDSSRTSGGSGPGVDAPGQIADVAGAIVPLAATIGSSIQKALAPISSFAARFGAQFDKVAGTAITLARRIDEAMKFPKFQAWVTNARTQVQGFAASSEGRIQRFARSVDSSLGAIQGISKLRNFFLNLGDVAGKTLQTLTKVKAPDVNFNSSTKSITNFYGATQAATGGLKSFAAQAALALGIFGLGYKSVEWLKTGIKGASDLGETMAKVEEVFKRNTGQVVAQADELAARFGITKQVSLDAAAGFGLMGKAAGLSGEKSAQLANEFTKLGGDVASFYNIPIDEALTKLRSGLAGEAEPLRALGVLLSEDAVKAEAWRSGIARAGEELTDQQKVMARSALIQKGLTTASGDLERTQGSAANQARKFSGSMTNLATTVGGFFLPALTKALGLLNRFGSFLGRVFEENKATFEAWGNTLGTVFDYVGAAFSDLPGVFEIGRLVILQGLLNLGEYLEVLGPNVVRVASYIGENWYQLIRDAIVGSLTLLKNFGSNVTALGEALGRFLADPTQGFEVNWTPLLDGFKSTVSQFPGLIKPQLTDMGKEIQAAKDKVFGGVGAAGKGGAGAVAGPRGVLNADAQEPQSIKDLKETAAFAKKLKEDIRTPLEKYAEEVRKLEAAKSAGLLNDEEFHRGRLHAARESGIDADPKFAGALELGSKEAYSSVVGAISGRSNPMVNIEKSGQETAANTARSAASLDAIAQKFNAPEVLWRIPG